MFVLSALGGDDLALAHASLSQQGCGKGRQKRKKVYMTENWKYLTSRFWTSREKEDEECAEATDCCRLSVLSSSFSPCPTLPTWSSRCLTMMISSCDSTCHVFQILLHRSPVMLHVIQSLSTCLLLLLIPLLTLIIDPEMRYRLAACSVLRHRVQVPTEDY